MSLQIPSIYWPIAESGCSAKPGLRRAFRFVFSNLYRKRLGEFLINSRARNKGFDRRKCVFQNNVHAIGSALLLFQAGVWLYYSKYLWVMGTGVVELVVIMPAIVLSRYLYLMTTQGHHQALQRTRSSRAVEHVR